MDEIYDSIILTHGDLFDSNNQIDTFKQSADSALKAFKNLAPNRFIQPIERRVQKMYLPKIVRVKQQQTE